MLSLLWDPHGHPIITIIITIIYYWHNIVLKKYYRYIKTKKIIQANCRSIVMEFAKDSFYHSFELS